jgi:hypothetical protein
LKIPEAPAHQGAILFTMSILKRGSLQQTLDQSERARRGGDS